MSVVGIDFGNQSCRIAVAHKGIVEVIANEVSNRKTPSMVAFDGRQRRLGESALTGIMSNSTNTVTEVKRLLGRRFSQAELQADRNGFMYNTVQADDDMIAVEVQYCDKVRIPCIILCVCAVLVYTHSSRLKNSLPNKLRAPCLVASVESLKRLWARQTLLIVSLPFRLISTM